jgi:hypothetical protein
MRRFYALVLVLAASTLAPFSLRAQDKIIVFGGYSYVRPPVTAEEVFDCPIGTLACPEPPAPTFVTTRQNLNGWEASATYRFLPFLGLAADFSGHYGPSFNSFSSNAHQHTYLFGPEVSLPSRVSPFAHVLFGVTHQSINASPPPNFIPVSPVPYNAIAATSDSGFAAAFGGGIDLRLVPHLWIRPIQLDYLVTRLHGGTQNQPRVSAGVVFHF